MSFLSITTTGEGWDDDAFRQVLPAAPVRGLSASRLMSGVLVPPDNTWVDLGEAGSDVDDESDSSSPTERVLALVRLTVWRAFGTIIVDARGYINGLCVYNRHCLFESVEEFARRLLPELRRYISRARYTHYWVESPTTLSQWFVLFRLCVFGPPVPRSGYRQTTLHEAFQ